MNNSYEYIYQKNNQNELNEILSFLDSDGCYEEFIYQEPTVTRLEVLSEYRKNIIQWYPFKEGASVLELKAECGAVTGGFLDKVSHAVSITDEELKAEIIKKRYRDYDNFNVVVADYRQYIKNLQEKFDYILFVGGVLSLEEVCQIRELLKDDGKLLIAAENRIGLKYLGGCRDEYTAGFYDGVNQYYGDSEQTYDLKEWNSLLKEAGFSKIIFRYPYPDYKFCETVYSDDFLPKKNQLVKNYRTFNGSRLISFDENRMFNTLIGQEIFPNFSNSFFIETDGSCGVIYTKFSKEREKKYGIYTSIWENEKGKTVLKYPAYEESYTHIRMVKKCRAVFQQMFVEKKIHIADCQLRENGLEFEYIKGKSLGSYIDKDISEKDFDELFKHLKILKEIFDQLTLEKSFIPDEKFKNFFKDVTLPSGLKKCKFSFLDLNLDNIILNDRINIIDYEWVLPFPLPVEYIVFRAIFLSWGISTLSEKRKKEIYDFLDVDYSMYDVFLKMEICFQRNISAKEKGLDAIFQKMPIKQYDLKFINFDNLINVSKVLDGKTKEVIGTQIQNNASETIEVILNKNVEKVIFEPAQQGVYMSVPVITAIKNNERIRIDKVTYNASFVDGQDLFFVNRPQFFFDNAEYEKIIIQYAVFIKDINKINQMIEERKAINQLREKVDRLKAKFRLIYNLYGTILKIKNKINRNI